MESIIIGNNELDLAVLAAIVDTGAPYDGAVVRLFQNDFLPTRSSVIADFTEADYTGYAEESITWLDPTQNDAGVPEVVGTVGEFRPSGTTTANNIFGAYITNAAGDELLGATRFPITPVPMASAIDSLIVIPRIRTFGQEGVGGLMMEVT